MATVMLTMIVITMAAGTITFVQTQQEGVTEPLTTALDQDLRVEDVTCHGEQVSVLFNNQGAQPVDSATAEVRVFEEGNINYTLSPLETLVTGPFLQAGSRGHFNITTGGVFESGDLYRIQIDLGVGNTIDRVCRAGADWWDLNYGYRIPVTVENNGDGAGTHVTSTTIQFDDLPGEFQDDCADIRVVEGGAVVPYELGGDPDPDADDCTDMTFLDFKTTINGSTTAYDTYIYYDNINADHGETLVSGEPNTDIDVRLGDTEQR